MYVMFVLPASHFVPVVAAVVVVVRPKRGTSSSAAEIEGTSPWCPLLVEAERSAEQGASEVEVAK